MLISMAFSPFQIPTSNEQGFNVSHPHLHLLLSVFLMVVILMHVKWYLTVV